MLDSTQRMNLTGQSPEEKLEIARSESVGTWSDATTFWSFVLLYLSIQRSYPVPVFCHDEGLTDQQRRWAASHLTACAFGPSKERSPDPGQRRLWIDPHTIVLRDLGTLFQLLDEGPLSVRSENGLPPILSATGLPGSEQDITARIGWAKADTTFDGGPAISQLRAAYPDAVLLAWGHLAEEKQLHPDAPESEALAGLARSIPGTHYAGRATTSSTGRIRLISHVGSKSHPTLISRFVDHYTRLGVDDFLVVLHGQPGDPRLAAARAALAAGGVVPVLETDVFSTPLKLERTNELMASHCEKNDWLLSADVDELQVYPASLSRLLGRCDEEGFTMVRGRFIDRFAEGGQLVPVQPNRSLWEQFPFGGEVTAQVTGGWPLKVCAIKGSLRFGDGGSHALDYGVDSFRNYAATHRDPAAFTEDVQIHHFKWEEGLLRRTQDKTKGVGGDREAIDGAEFMHEYRALLAHIERHGHLHVEGARLIGTPTLHYVRESVLVDP